MRPSLILAALLAASAALAAEEQLTPYQWQQAQKVAFEKSEKIYTEALKRDGLLAQFKAMRDAYRGDPNHAFRVVFGQYMSWYQSFVGDYEGAHDAYSIRQLPASDDSASPLAGGYTSKPALDAIAELAKGRKAIFFNEAHNVPLTRTLTVEMLPRLRAEGYNYFAAETIYSADKDLQSRGYPIPKSGFYTMEPICGEMIRTALKLGFKVVGYESEKEGNGDVREYDQAKNLYERVFKHDPNARVVVNAGYAHIQESGTFLQGSSMAEHFRKLSGIDPLTVEQTMMIDHPPGTENHPYYHAVVDSLKPTAPIVFLDKDGKPWSLKAKAYDVSVIFPVDQIRDDRPTWLTLGGLRKPYFVDGATFCQSQYPCLIEARYADESDDSIPGDRLVLNPVEKADRLEDRLVKGHGQAQAYLYLRPGKYHVMSTNEANRVLYRQDITVEGDAGH
jgi:tetratricopeptide (TPR) repeat protein